jgi:titin
MKKLTGLLLLAVLGFVFPVRAEAAHSVTLTWTASADSSSVIGYNVYRGTAAGGESSTALNSTPLAVGCSGSTCTYSDTAVSAGVTYYYTLKAINTTTGVLSVASNEASATVPIAPPTGVTAVAQ